MQCKFKEGDTIKCTVNKFNYVDNGDIVTIRHIGEHWVSFHRVHEMLYAIHDVNQCFELVESAEGNKWHPHHDLILKWLSSEDMRVDLCSSVGNSWREVDAPTWNMMHKYRVYHKDTTPEQLEIEDVKHQIKQLQDKLNKLEAVHGK